MHTFGPTFVLSVFREGDLHTQPIYKGVEDFFDNRPTWVSESTLRSHYTVVGYLFLEVSPYGQANVADLFIRIMIAWEAREEKEPLEECYRSWACEFVYDGCVRMFEECNE